MRLVCPNCGAQYEVDDRVIPDSGRDVQCSSCGHGWYQMPAHVEAAAEPEPAEPEDIGAADDETGAGFEAEPDLPAEPEPEIAAHPDAGAAPEMPGDDAEPVAAAGFAAFDENADEDEGDDDAEPDDEDDDGAAPLAAGSGLRRELDENLRAILQEEVAREMEARAADRAPEGLETQPDLGSGGGSETAGRKPLFEDAPSAGFDDDALPDISPEPDDGADDTGPAAAAAAGAATAQASRRDLFPDIEEINSTLDSRGPMEEPYDDEAEDRRGGFSRGFFAIIFIAALALALYLVAPQLANSVPVLEPALGAYVGAVNGAREWLDALLQGVTSRISTPDNP